MRHKISSYFLLILLILIAKPLFATTYLPVTYDANGFFHLNSGQGTYVGFKPITYNPATPISLFVWMHGCGNNAEGDMWSIAPPATRANQSYIAISIGGRDGACWDVNADSSKVLTAITDAKKYFNINPLKIYLGGYSSGGDLAYRTAFYNAGLFAGVLVENSSPFRDTGSNQANSLAAAARKFNVAHLAHLQDTTYPIAGVRIETDILKNAGYPITRIEKAGTHWDANIGTTGTNYDLIHFLLPYLDSGWSSAPVFSGDFCYKSHVTQRDTGPVNETFTLKIHVKSIDESTCVTTMLVAVPNDNPFFSSGTCIISSSIIYINFTGIQLHKVNWVDTSILQMKLDRVSLNGTFSEISHDYNSSTHSFSEGHASGTVTKIGCP